MYSIRNNPEADSGSPKLGRFYDYGQVRIVAGTAAALRVSVDALDLSYFNFRRRISLSTCVTILQI